MARYPRRARHGSIPSILGRYRTSTNGGATWSSPLSGAAAVVTAEGTTIAEFRTVDGAGNASPWTPTAPGTANTVKLDRTAPTLATVAGGSLTCAMSRTVTGSGATDAGSGVARYEYRLSPDGGTTWGASQTGASVRLTTPGTFLVEFRAMDGVGLAGAWAPVSSGPANTACIT